MAAKQFEHHDSIVFLAMYWGGGGPYELADIVHVYDWINRDVLDAAELAGALNRLLAAGLIEKSKSEFCVPKSVFDSFTEFRRHRKKDRFDVADSYVKQFEPLPKVTRHVHLTEARYRKVLKQYHEAFERAIAESTGKSKKTSQEVT